MLERRMTMADWYSDLMDQLSAPGDFTRSGLESVGNMLTGKAPDFGHKAGDWGTLGNFATDTLGWAGLTGALGLGAKLLPGLRGVVPELAESATAAPITREIPPLEDTLARWRGEHVSKALDIDPRQWLNPQEGSLDIDTMLGNMKNEHSALIRSGEEDAARRAALRGQPFQLPYSGPDEQTHGWLDSPRGNNNPTDTLPSLMGPLPPLRPQVNPDFLSQTKITPPEYPMVPYHSLESQMMPTGTPPLNQMAGQPAAASEPIRLPGPTYADPFYSRLKEAAQTLPENVKAASLENMLKRAPGGISQEELNYTLPKGLLPEKGVIPKQRVLDAIDQNGISVETKVKLPWVFGGTAGLAASQQQ
jgi:hypothetical protein